MEKKTEDLMISQVTRVEGDTGKRTLSSVEWMLNKGSDDKGTYEVTGSFNKKGKPASYSKRDAVAKGRKVLKGDKLVDNSRFQHTPLKRKK